MVASLAFTRTQTLLLLLLLVSLLPQNSQAQSASEYYYRAWQTDDGLPSATVTGIYQSTNGYLWLGTLSGMARFDGVKFEEIPVPLGRTKPIIRTMLCDRSETFWLAQDGGVVVKFGPDGAAMFTPTNGLPDATPVQMVESGDKSIWISYSEGLVCRIRPDSLVTRYSSTNELPGRDVGSLTVDTSGALWCSKTNHLSKFVENHFVELDIPLERPGQWLASRNGDFLICTANGVMRRGTNGVSSIVAHFDLDQGVVKPSVLFEDSKNRLWIGTSTHGLFLYDIQELKKIDTTQNNIRAIMEDREGNIWVGTDGGGLNRIRPRIIELLGRDEGLPFETVRSITEDTSGAIWVVTQDGSITRLDSESTPSGQRMELFPEAQAHSIVADKDGSVWIGTFLNGVYNWKNGKITQFNTRAGLASRTVRSMMLDSHRGLWIGLELGRNVQRLKDGQFETFKQPPESRAVRAIEEDASGHIWLSTLDGRLLSAESNRLVEVRQPESVVSHPIRCLRATDDGGLWLGYSVAGICRYKNGKFSHISLEEGLFDASICSIMPDNQGRMWFSSDRGIFYVLLSDLNRCADGKATNIQSIVMGRDAGLSGIQGYYNYWPGSIITKSGHILFPTHSGVAVVHPERVKNSEIAPNILIQSAVADGTPLNLDKKISTKRLNPGVKKLEITFTSPSFVGPERVRFRYRLQGWDEDWSAPQRERSVSFQRLPPGNYIFEVMARNQDGLWSLYPDQMRFFIGPYFWQRWNFKLAVILVCIALIIFIVRHFSLRRVKQMLEKVERESALQKERTRIAQDMHDELGARFTHISLLGELSRHSTQDQEKLTGYLNQISGVARVGVRSLDEIVWAVNPRNDSLAELLDYTGQYAVDFISTAGLHCRLDFPEGQPNRIISGDIRHSVFLIIKESLHNVVKHAQASRVRIQFQLHPESMTWRIEDDGKGFKETTENSLADGLRNLRQRAAALGGTLAINSTEGQGTTICLTVPIPAETAKS